VTNFHPVNEEKRAARVTVLSVAPRSGEAFRRIHDEESVSHAVRVGRAHHKEESVAMEMQELTIARRDGTGASRWPAAAARGPRPAITLGGRPAEP
jgi:hypothetical protein